VLLGRDVRAVRVDVVHAPTIDFISLRPGAPLVATVHDLAPLKHPDRYLRTGAKHRFRYGAVRRAARVIVPSRVVADDCIGLLGLPAARIAVVAEAAADVFHPRPDARELVARLALPERFLLWVGGLDPPDPRKGVRELAAAVARGDGPPLVLAGRIGSEASNLSVRGRVQLVGRVADDELAALYTLAQAVVFPSSDEGFGLPPTEALACRSRVVAFAAGALAETLAGQSGADLVPAGDFDALLAAANQDGAVAVEPPARRWRDVARETLAVYEDAASGRAST
jgi:glycosyltransferase involved in cell wall biosynthesis